MPRRRRKRGRRKPLTGAVVTRSACRRSTSPEPKLIEAYGGGLPGTPVELENAEEVHDDVDDDEVKTIERAEGRKEE